MDTVKKWALIGIALGYLALFIFFPLLQIFYYAFQKGGAFYLEIVSNSDVLTALKLSALVVAIVVPINGVFGVLSAWLIAKFSFRGKSLLLSLIDLPLSVSPVISGAIFILLLGANSALGAWFIAHDVPIIFAFPGIVIVTLFVTFPYVAREVISIMKALGKEEEEAGMTLGANGWQIFSRITLPNIKWGLFYGVVLCATRALGEFGAVSVVSGHIRGATITLPLEVEILYNEYAFVATFAVSTLFVCFALITLAVKAIITHKYGREGAR
jgi:sulfate transport system permease protein